jgi:hypothetical protein
MSLHNAPGKSAVKQCGILFVVIFAVSLSAYAGPSRERRRSETRAAAVTPAETAAPGGIAGGRRLLIGADEGLFILEQPEASPAAARALWSGASVRKIVPLYAAGITPPAGSGDVEAWAILSSEGVFVSTDLQEWENRSHGLPVKTIKTFQDGKKSFFPMVQEIKDLEANGDIMVCATKDRVYLSRDRGRSWSSLGAPPYRTNGIKAVAAAHLPAGNGGDNVLTVFLSHSTYGLFYIQPDRSGAQWAEINKGLEKLETTGNTDEVSDIAVVPAAGILPPAAGSSPAIYVSQTFRRRVYRLDWERKTFELLWGDTAPFGTADSLDAGRTGLRFVRESAVAEIDYSAAAGGKASVRPRADLLELVRAIPASLSIKPNCVVIRENPGSPDSELVALSELWLLDEHDPESAARTAAFTGSGGNDAGGGGNDAGGKEGLYLPVNHAMDSYSLRPYLNVINERGLNMIVIDMKDDYGRLRFSPRNPAISGKGRVFRPLDIDAFLQDMRERGIYTVARVVVFKDPELAAKENGKYAVWDAKTGKAWAGYHDSRKKQSAISDEDRQNEHITILPADAPDYAIVRTFYDERWVDPYSEEVWEYTAAVAEELHQRGFDEIQFDYIRFPTDGVNLADARYRWQENGMDMESAILSFLRHIRSRVSAPVSIDIYGANGWYRTGARTGQEVELLAPWVDVICPMYYPSHFEQDFLAQEPAEERPYRIYYQGTMRTARIGRGKIIVRPYVQAFYLNVSYDRTYYNPDYVRREAEGVRDAGKPGFTYWNNSGRYDDIPGR